MQRAVKSGCLGISKQLVATGALWLSGFLLTVVAEAVSMYRFPKGAGWPPTPGEQNPPLPDYGFDFFKYYCFVLPGTSWGLPDAMVAICGILTLLRFIVFDKRRWQIAQRFFIIDSFLLYLRCVTEVVTSLNNPNPRCNNCGGVCPTSLVDSIWLMIHHFPLKLCGGLIFSAHTCYYLLAALIWRRYSEHRWVSYVLWLVSIFGMYTLISCRYHYTVDVVLAVVLCVLYWCFIHTAIDALPLSSLSKDRNLFVRFLSWVESAPYEH